MTEKEKGDATYVHNALRATSRTRCVKDEKRVLGADNHGRAVRGDLGGLLMPPLVTALDHVHITSSALENQNVLDAWCTLERGINDRLGGNGLASTATLIGCDNHTRRAIDDTITEGLSAKSSENNAVHSTNTSASEEGSGRVPCHGQVNTDGIALVHTKLLKDVGDPASLAEKLGVGDSRALTRLIGLVDNGGLRGPK